MLSRLYVCNARKLDILAELRVGPSQIGAGHSDEVAKTSNNTTVATVEVWFGVGVTIAMRSQNFLGVMLLRESSGAGDGVTGNFTSKVVFDGAFICVPSSYQSRNNRPHLQRQLQQPLFCLL